MTSNESMNVITKQLDTAATKDINIKINHDINTSVNFLDVTITNEQGQLRTSVYHKSAAEPYILPYTSDHPRHIHRNIPYAALLRSARLCSSVEDFDAECIRLDVSLLLTDYPPTFIEEQTDRFSRLNQAMLVKNELNPVAYQRLHQTALNRKTRREVTVIELTQDPVRSPDVLQPKRWDTSVMYPRYTFDRAYTVHLHDRFHKWWNHFYRYPGSPVRLVKVNLTASVNSTLEQKLIHKKPPKHVLTINKSDTTTSENQQNKHNCVE